MNRLNGLIKQRGLGVDYYRSFRPVVTSNLPAIAIFLPVRPVNFNISAIKYVVTPSNLYCHLTALRVRLCDHQGNAVSETHLALFVCIVQ